MDTVRRTPRDRGAGMDAYLSNPLTPATMMQTIEVLARNGRAAGSSADGLPALDSRTIASLRGFFSAAQFEAFIAESRDEMLSRVGRLGPLLDAGDAATAVREAHDLVSIAGNCGARSISALAREVEQASKREDLGLARARYAAIGRVAEEAMSALETLQRSQDPCC